MLALKNKLGWIIIVLLAIFPILPWALMRPLSLRFADFFAIATSLGQITGLVGMVLFSLVIILSARLKFLDKYLNGLNQVYIDHHWLGGLALVLLLLHPLFLVIKFIPISLNSAALFLLPGANWAINCGIFGLLLMVVLLVLTFYIKLPYQIWKFSHRFLGLAFFLGVLHTFLIPSDISRNFVIRNYIFLLVMLAVLAIAYRLGLYKLLLGNNQFVVSAVRPIGNAVVEIELADGKKKFKFVAGQFIFVSFSSPGFSAEAHPFTISSSPDATNIKLSIKALGDYTAILNQLQPGAIAQIEGPFGQFSFFNTINKNQIWVAGGIGITPFLSMAKEFKNNLDYNAILFYCVKNQAEAVYYDQLALVTGQSSNFKIVSYCSGNNGRLTAIELQKMSNGFENKDILLCGPVVMMRGLRQQMNVMGVDNELIHSEEFSMY